MNEYQIINLNENTIWLSFPTIELGVISLMKWRNAYPEIKFSLQDDKGFIISQDEITVALEKVFSLTLKATLGK